MTNCSWYQLPKIDAEKTVGCSGCEGDTMGVVDTRDPDAMPSQTKAKREKQALVGGGCNYKQAENQNWSLMTWPRASCI